MRKGAPFAGYKDFAACVAANSDKNDPEAYCGKIKHQVEGTRKMAGATCACGEAADGTCAACDKPVCDEHATMHDHDRFCSSCSGSHQAASQLPQIQQFVDPQGNPDPGGDQLNPEVMWPLNPASGGEGGDEDEGKSKQAARSSMTPSNTALRMFGRMDAMEGKPAPHKDSYVFGRKGHGQYLRGHNETRGVIDATMGREPVDKKTYGERTGRPDLHAHYLGVYSDVKARRDLDVTSRVPGERAFSNEPGGYQASLRRQADILTRPHQSTDDLNPPFNSAQTSPDPWSSSEGSGDYGQGVKDGQDDAAAGEHPTFADNSSLVSPYVKGYSVGYSGRPADTGTLDVPRSMGGDSGQAGNAADAQRAFQVSRASLQRQADYQRPYEHDSYDYVDPSVRSAIPQHVMHDLWRRDPDAGETEPTDADYDRFRDYVRRTHGQDVHDAYFGHGRTGMRRQAGQCLGCPHPPHLGQPCNAEGCRHLHNEGEEGGGPGRHARTIGHEPDPDHPGYSRPRGGRQSARKVSAAFITPEAVREPDFRKGYQYAARWQPGRRLVSQGSPAFEAGLYAAIADRPGGVQARWVVAHQKLAARHPALAHRVDAHAGFTRKLLLAEPGRYQPSATGCYPVRRQAATSVDLITDGPGTSPDPMGSTPLNGPGTPPAMGGGEDPARSGGVPPYQGAPPPASAPVAPDDVVGQPQEPPQPGGPMTQTFSGRHPENADLAPAAPNTAAGPGYQNQDAYQGDPMHKPQAMAFRRRVQAGLAAQRAG
jgi:hypothetical protein